MVLIKNYIVTLHHIYLLRKIIQVKLSEDIAINLFFTQHIIKYYTCIVNLILTLIKQVNLLFQKIM
jgi:hypothetical protein